MLVSLPEVSKKTSSKLGQSLIKAIDYNPDKEEKEKSDDCDVF